MKAFFRLIQKNRSVIFAIVLIGVIYSIFFLTGIGCPIKFITGVSCPGCGMTRAVYCSMALDFEKAFYYHPLFVVLPLSSIILLLLKLTNKNKAFRLVLSLTVMAFIVTYFIRFYYGPKSVVGADFKQSFIYKLIKKFLEVFDNG